MTHLDYDAGFKLKCTYHVWHGIAWLVFADMFIFIGFHGELLVPSSPVPECLATLGKSPDSTQLAPEINRTVEASHWQPEATGHLTVCVTAVATPRSPHQMRQGPASLGTCRLPGKGTHLLPHCRMRASGLKQCEPEALIPSLGDAAFSLLLYPGRTQRYY